MQEVLVYGSNGKGQLGLNHMDDISRAEICFQTNERILNIANGSNHTMILLDNGDVYACGVNLAYFDTSVDIIKKFQKVASGVKLIEAGWDFSVLVNHNDEVVMLNAKGITNFGKLNKNNKNDSIAYIRASLNAIIVVYKSSKSYCWGDNKKGQLLGDCPGAKMISEFTEVCFDDIPNAADLRLENIQMSRYFNVFLLMNEFLNQQVLVLRCKTDNYKMIENLKQYLHCEVIGTPGVNRSLVFEKGQYIGLEDLKTMWSSIHIRIEGKIYSTGSNVYGQLFSKDAKYKCLKFGSFTTGTEHGVAMDELRSKVYAWGWGEHGNCGIVQDYEDKGQLRLLYMSKQNKKINSLYAGYANTWIVLEM